MEASNDFGCVVLAEKPDEMFIAKKNVFRIRLKKSSNGFKLDIRQFKQSVPHDAKVAALLQKTKLKFDLNMKVINSYAENELFDVIQFILKNRLEQI